MATDEIVLCLQRDDLAHLFGGRLPQGGFVGPDPERLLALRQYFLPRRQAEVDCSYKQLIPYQLFGCQGRFFVYQRGGGVGEGRLAGRLSLGIGGHINSGDSDGGCVTPTAYQRSLLRERNEEMVGPLKIDTTFLGWINDDSDPVGQVHLGAVHLGQVTDPASIRIRAHGEDLHAQGWWSGEEIEAQKECFEKWSLLAVELTVLFT
ncbi:MAG: phosphoesterase [Desulfofustis sp. PB-SRB1]|jgi:predicted NUDIX family phosphoesterase|nr:phosphoesterase [Desulfofustis sp. PB-SRB1]MBM1003510.1 phosphoesterase [Desulfofustis sp. PB-SRB1]HBH27807.1 phosphoesterase [Desulfofustis sp.]HBH32937.1 phosphoesterase [Desulfofustis sp.]